MTRLENFLEIIRIVDRSIDLIDVTIERTGAGNWAVYNNGYYSHTVSGYLLTDQEAEGAGIVIGNMDPNQQEVYIVRLETFHPDVMKNKLYSDCEYETSAEAVRAFDAQVAREIQFMPRTRGAAFVQVIVGSTSEVIRSFYCASDKKDYLGR
jgi:hypothetical protein